MTTAEPAQRGSERLSAVSPFVKALVDADWTLGTQAVHCVHYDFGERQSTQTLSVSIPSCDLPGEVLANVERMGLSG
jgi:hypothetical protein